jgi:hypothetical protein
VTLTTRHLTRSPERRATVDAIGERVLGSFQDEPAIAFTYPTHAP